MMADRLAWGARVSPAFRTKVRAIAKALDVDASWLTACIAWESGETFSATILNKAGSGAVGLIQFMPAVAKALGTTTLALSRMTAEQQLDWVERYFRPYAGKLHGLGDLYMAILWPAAIGRPDSAVLWDRDSRPTTYRQNAGLDVDHDGRITKAEAYAKVHDELVRGLRPENAV